MPPIQRITIVGAGIMGVSIADALLNAGLSPKFIDIDDARLLDARRRLRGTLRARRLLTGQPTRIDQTLASLTLDTEINAVSDAHLIIECVPEDIALKQKVLALIEQHAPHDAPIVTNTSSIPIAALSNTLRDPRRLIGVHFMNPVSARTTVEWIAPETHPHLAQRTRALLDALGLNPIVVADTPGFVVNRILMAAINQAIALLDEGAAPPADIDALFCGGLGHRSGPLATADLIGLDNVLDTLHTLHRLRQDPRYLPHPLLKHLVSLGHLGHKSGRGLCQHLA